MARSSPFTRLFTHFVEDVQKAVEEQDMDTVEQLLPDMKRLATMILNDARFADELPKDMRERLQFVVMN